MKTKILAGFFCFLFYNAAIAQKSSIKLISSHTSTDTLIASAELFRMPDSVRISKKLFSGLCIFDTEKNTDYFVRVTATGREVFERRVRSTADTIIVDVNFSNKITDLQQVTVVSRKPFITQDDDKTIVDAEVLANSSINALEVLEKTPGLIVDQDGNVYLNSSTPATIQLNGREIKLSSSDLASLLKSLPATSVQKIEILRSPSAKYDASGSGGIINIVLKKGVNPGTSGSVHTGYFQGVYATNFIGLSLNKTGKKINTYFSYSFMKRNNHEELTSDRQTNRDTMLSQRSYTTYPVLNNYVSAGFDYSKNSAFSLAYDVKVSANNTKSNAVNDIDFIIPSSGESIGNNTSVIKNRGTNYYINNELTSKYKIDTTGSEWTSSLGYSYFNNRNKQVYDNYFIEPAFPTVAGDGATRNLKNIFRFQTDVVLKLKHKITIEAGVKASLSGSNIAADYFYRVGSGIRQPDNFQTNAFRYRENIFATYLQVAKTLAGFTIKPGIRFERTDISGHQLIPADTTLRIKRTDAFPYVYVRHTLLKMFGFTLTGNAIYRRSITRPYYEALNPYRKYIDQFLYETGNPGLLPQFTTNYEFNIMADDYPVFSIGINDTRNIFTNVTYTDSITKIAFRTYDNLGHNKEMYLRFIVGIPPGKKYFFYAGAQHNLNKYNGFYQKTPIQYTRGSWVLFMYHNYKITTGLTLTAHGFMRLRGLQNFYELNSFGALNMSLNKTIFRKKGNLILSANDIFGTNKVEFRIQQPGINASGLRLNDTKRFGLTLRYNIGIKPKEEKKEMFDSNESKNE